MQYLALQLQGSAAADANATTHSSAHIIMLSFDRPHHFRANPPQLNARESRLDRGGSAPRFTTAWHHAFPVSDFLFVSV
jgi:hypothetical protein